MKINKVLFSVLLLTVSGIAVAAGAAASATAGNPGFDIINRTGKDITILVNNGYKNIKQAIVKPAKTALGVMLPGQANNVSASININEPTLLVVYEGAHTNKIEPFRARGGDEGTQKFFFDWLIQGPKAKHYLYHFKPGKKIYVTLNANGALKPQSGTLGGALGRTTANYSLDNVVSQPDIIQFDEQYKDYVTIR